MIEIQAEEHVVMIPDHFTRSVQPFVSAELKNTILIIPTFVDACAALVLAKIVYCPSAVVASGVEPHVVWKVRQCAASTLTTLPPAASAGQEAMSV